MAVREHLNDYKCHVAIQERWIISRNREMPRKENKDNKKNEDTAQLHQMISNATWQSGST